MATRTIANGGGNWDALGTWVEGAVPIAGDAVVATGTSGQLTINVAAGGVGLLSFIMTNYTNTLTMNATLTVAGTVTFVSGMSIAGTSDLICTTTATLTSGGKTLTGGMQFKGTSQTYTMSGAWIITGVMTCSGTTQITINSSTISVAGGLTISTATQGTCVITMTGGTWTTAGTFKNSLTFAGNATVSGTCTFNTGTITYTSGTITVAGSTLSLTASCTINTGTMNWNNITLTGTSQTFTMSSTLKMTGNLTLSGLTATTFSGVFQITCVNFVINTATAETVTLTGDVVASGDLTLANTTSTTFSTTHFVQAATATVSGTQTINIPVGEIVIIGTTTISDACVFNDSGSTGWQTGGLTTTGSLTGTATILLGAWYDGTTQTWTGAAGTLSNNLSLTGNLTISGTVLYAASGTPDIIYSSGTITTTGSTLSIASSCTFDTGTNVTFNNVTLSAALTLTLTSILLATGTLTMPNAAVSFAGAGGFTVGTFTNTTITATRIYTFGSLFPAPYTITNALTTVHAAAQTVRFTFKSDSAGNKAIFTLNGPATQDVGFVDPTDIDSSRGQTIFTYRGSVTTTTNWGTAIPVNVLRPNITSTIGQ